ncbi:hypothetical protein ACLOJK_012984 [Asimina triloba]
MADGVDLPARSSALLWASAGSNGGGMGAGREEADACNGLDRGAADGMDEMGKVSGSASGSHDGLLARRSCWRKGRWMEEVRGGAGGRGGWRWLAVVRRCWREAELESDGWRGIVASPRDGRELLAKICGWWSSSVPADGFVRRWLVGSLDRARWVDHPSSIGRCVAESKGEGTASSEIAAGGGVGVLGEGDGRRPAAAGLGKMMMEHHTGAQCSGGTL